MSTYTIRLLLPLLVIIHIGCSPSKKIIYNVMELPVLDTIAKLPKTGKQTLADNNWIGLIKPTPTGFELVLNNNIQKVHPFMKLAKKTNRFIRIKNMMVPLIFAADLYSAELQAIKIVDFNFGGYWFDIVQKDGKYLIKEFNVVF